MFGQDTRNRLLAAAFSAFISAGLFAYAIVPASPNGVFA